MTFGKCKKICDVLYTINYFKAEIPLGPARTPPLASGTLGQMMIESCYGTDRLTQDTGPSTVTADPMWFNAEDASDSEVVVSKPKDPRFTGIGKKD